MNNASRAIQDLMLACEGCNGPLGACDCHYSESGLPDCAKGFFYRSKDTGDNSNRFGPCEICGTHCPSVHTQTEFRFYLDTDSHRLAITYSDCRGVTFGHKVCLDGIKR